MQSWAIAGVILIAGLNLFASVCVVRSISLGRAQRWLQLSIVWMAPVVGAILILAFLMADRPRSAGRTDGDAETASGDIALLDTGANPCGCSGPGAESD